MNAFQVRNALNAMTNGDHSTGRAQMVEITFKCGSKSIFTLSADTSIAVEVRAHVAKCEACAKKFNALKHAAKKGGAK